MLQKNKPESPPAAARYSPEHMDITTVKESMMRLNRNHYEILVLVCAQGMHYAEAAALLAVPVETIRTRLAAARQQLHNLMHMSEELYIA